MAKSFSSIVNGKTTASQTAAIRAARLLGGCSSVAEFNAAVEKVLTLQGVLNQTGEYKGIRLSGAANHTPEETIRVATASVKAQGWTTAG